MRFGFVGALEERLEVAHLECHILVVGDAAHDLTHQQRFAVAVDGAHLLGRLRLPFGPIARRMRALGFVLGACAAIAHHTDLDCVEQQLTPIIAQLRELRVEVPCRHGRRDTYSGGTAHFHERHDHFVEDAEIHVRGLFAVQNVAADAAQRCHLCIEENGGAGARE